MRACPTCQRTYIDSLAACPFDQAALGDPDGTKPAGSLGKELGSYKLISLLGKGGMGSIYIGAHLRLNRFVAIKLLRRELDKRKENIARFFDEARTLNRIKHPNIVESIDLVEDVVDGAYCVMELLNGPDLKTRMAGGPLPLETAVHIGTQIADALSAAHAIDIVHRDLKPENLILVSRGDDDDFVKLIDFGVAQISDTGTSGAIGTPAYMAPEQAAGNRVDGRADVYALGVLLYEMTVGEHPFPSTTDSEYLLRHADEEPAPPSERREMPKALETVILRCLAKVPADRYASAHSVAVALRAVDLEAHAVATPRRGGRGMWIATAVLVLGGGAAAAVLVPPYLAKRDAAAPAGQPAMTAARPVEPAAPAPTTPPAPELVTIELTSTPSGATVTRVGETVPLGVTPFSVALVRSDKPSRVRFELAGHEPAEIDVALTASNAVDTPLTRIPAVVSKKPPVVPKKKPEGDGGKKLKSVQREGVMDPFAN